VVAGGEYIGSKVEQVFSDLRRNAKSACGILGIDYNEIDGMRIDDMANVLAHNLATRASEDVTDEKNVQEDGS
jgi:hypothetical protein